MKQGNNKILIIFIIVFAVILTVYLVYNRGLLFKDDDITLNSGNSIQKNDINLNSGELIQNEKEENNANKVNDDEYIVIPTETKTIGDVEFSNIRVKLERRNKTELIVDAQNLTDKYLEAKHIKIKAIDDNGEVISTFASILEDLAPYEPTTFKAYVLVDITNAVDIEFEEIID